MRHKVEKIVLTLLLMLGSMGVGHAQWVVSDPSNFFGNLLNVGQELASYERDFQRVVGEFKKLYEGYKNIEAVGEMADRTYRTFNLIRSSVYEGQQELKNAKYITPEEQLLYMQLYLEQLKSAKRVVDNLTNLSSKIFPAGGNESSKHSAGLFEVLNYWEVILDQIGDIGLRSLHVTGEWKYENMKRHKREMERWGFEQFFSRPQK